MKYSIYVCAVAVFITLMSMTSQTFASPYFGDSWQLGDASSYTQITDVQQSGLDIDGDLTFECWVKFDTTQDYFSAFKDDGGDPDSSPYGFNFQPDTNSIAPDDYLARMVNNPNDSRAQEADHSILVSRVTPETWHHASWVFRSTDGEFDFYLSGEHQGTASGMNTSMWDSAGPFVVGSNRSTPTHAHLRQCRMWNIARPATDIVRDMYRTLDISSPGLVSDWSFDGDFLDRTGRNPLVPGVSSYHPTFSTHIGPIAVRKSDLTSMTNSTTLTPDTELSAPLVLPHTTYVIQGALLVSATGGIPDFKFGVRPPSDADVKVSYIALTGNDRSTGGILSSPNQESLRIRVLANTPAVIHLSGTIVTGDTPGQASIDWSQFALAPAGVTMLPGSFISAIPQ
jgi:hypothetical protein